MVSELQKAKGFNGVIAATRKTTPGMIIYIEPYSQKKLNNMHFFRFQIG